MIICRKNRETKQFTLSERIEWGEPTRLMLEFEAELVAELEVHGWNDMRSVFDFSDEVIFTLARECWRSLPDVLGKAASSQILTMRHRRIEGRWWLILLAIEGRLNQMGMCSYGIGEKEISDFPFDDRLLSKDRYKRYACRKASELEAERIGNVT